MSDEIEEPVKKPRWLVLVLSLAPIWLAVSAVVAVWWSVSRDDKDEEERNRRFAMEMSEERIADDMRKLDEVIGPRNLTDEASRRGLTRAAAMVEGILGPSNTGYTITRLPGPEDFPLICAELKSPNRNAPSIWVVAAYDNGDQDDPDTWPQAAAVPTQPSASATASLIAIAQAMSRDKPESNIHFMLVPHGHDSESPAEEMITILSNRFPKPARVFCISSMADTPELFPLVANSAEGTFNIPEDLASPTITNTLGPIAISAEEKGLPVIVIQTGVLGRANTPNPAQNIAISSGKLVEWLRRESRLAPQD